MKIEVQVTTTKEGYDISVESFIVEHSNPHEIRHLLDSMVEEVEDEETRIDVLVKEHNPEILDLDGLKRELYANWEWEA